MREGTGLVPYEKKFTDRYYDVGIAEGHAVTFSAGLATQGVRPIVAIYSTFLQRAFDHIVHDVCVQGLPVIFCKKLQVSPERRHHVQYDQKPSEEK